MNPDKFVKVIHMFVCETAIADTISLLEEPPGRSPNPKDIELSKWYLSLPTDQQKKIELVAKMASELAIFSMFCVLDGVQVIEDSRKKGKLELYFVKNGKSTLLNPESGEMLHDLFNEKRQPPV